MSNSFTEKMQTVLWPIKGAEHKKFLPMAIMMFFILMNYSAFRSIKDGLVITGLGGAEVLGFLKSYFVLPSTMIATIIYIKLCNAFEAKKVFYMVMFFFIGFLCVFSFVLYPNLDAVHSDPQYIDELASYYPRFQWFIRIWGKWSYGAFYVVSELWGVMVLSVLFWQFANAITKTEEAKRFYSTFGLVGNLGLYATSFMIDYFVNKPSDLFPKDLYLMPIFIIAILSSFAVIAIYYWMNKYVLPNEELSQKGGAKPKKAKVKLSLKDSFRLIISSKYLAYIAILVIGYGLSINIVEGVWKSKLKDLFPLQNDYIRYMGKFQSYQATAAILVMIFGSNILRLTSWRTAAMLTPLMMIITGIAFFSFVVFENAVGPFISFVFAGGSLAAAVHIGMIQNVLSKGVKYSLFDSTKNMAYIPFDANLRAQGQAAVETIGGRLGKSGGGWIQSTFFLLFPSFTYFEATPCFAIIFFVIVLLWLLAVNGLNKEYLDLLKSNEEKDKVTSN